MDPKNLGDAVATPTWDGACMADSLKYASLSLTVPNLVILSQTMRT